MGLKKGKDVLFCKGFGIKEKRLIVCGGIVDEELVGVWRWGCYYGGWFF